MAGEIAVFSRIKRQERCKIVDAEQRFAKLFLVADALSCNLLGEGMIHG
jgi:hypothetical protein